MFALAVAFLLEIAVLVAFASLGMFIHGHTWMHVIASVALFLLLMLFWGTYMAHKATKKVGVLAYYLWKIPIYGLATAAIFMHLDVAWGTSFIVLVILDEAVLFRHNIS